jgi:hypothetical protein
MYTLNTGNEDIPEWTEENKQKLTEALQYIKERYRPSAHEEQLIELDKQQNV